MELYFLRHGDALAAEPRPLSDEGVEEVRAVAQRLKALGLRPDAILTSPLLRAQQTAQIVGDMLKVEPQVSELLNGGARLEDFAEAVGAHRRAGCLLLVGHEPDFSGAIRRLTGGVVDMKKAGIARVDCDRPEDGAGVLKWLAPPKLMRG